MQTKRDKEGNVYCEILLILAISFFQFLYNCISHLPWLKTAITRLVTLRLKRQTSEAWLDGGGYCPGVSLRTASAYGPMLRTVTHRSMYFTGRQKHRVLKNNPDLSIMSFLRF